MSGTYKTHRFTVRLTPSDFAKLHDIADLEGFKPSAIVRHLIIRYLKSCRSSGVF